MKTIIALFLSILVIETGYCSGVSILYGGDCKIFICACCGLSDIGFNIYTIDGQLVATKQTGNDGCMDEAPIGPYSAGTTFYVEPTSECSPNTPRTYFTITCCINVVDTIKVLCCDNTDNMKSNTDNSNARDFELFQNFPNPFNPNTRISFYLPEESDVNLSIYDVTGKKIATLIDGKTKKGYNELIWEPLNLASGIYFYKLEAGNYTAERKMVIVK